MKKNSWLMVLGSLIMVLVLSFFCTQFLFPLFKTRTYSETNCLTDSITEDMDVYDIAKLYRDSNATVAVIVKGQSSESGNYVTSLGSGVSVASKGYETTSLSEKCVANKGSYYVTNYHVIEMYDNSRYKSVSVSIMVEDENTYSCEVLWFNKELDLALIYCDTLNSDYVKMEDRWIACDENKKLDYETIFTIGSPLDTMYINRLTVGNIASNNELTMVTVKSIYPYSSNGRISYYEYMSSNFAFSTTVLDNVYEDVIDVSLGITSGNSGGGCFTEDGVLIGLTTLGSDADETGGNQMNGVVSIYPVIEVLDKMILKNEMQENEVIIDIKSLGLVGMDAYEAVYSSYIKSQTSYSYYFLNEAFYDSSYSSDFNFSDDGYYILSNNNSYSALSSVSRGCIITSCQINNENLQTIADRNDLLYILLQVDSGDNLKINFKDEIGNVSSASLQF